MNSKILYNKLHQETNGDTKTRIQIILLMCTLRMNINIIKTSHSNHFSKTTYSFMIKITIKQLFSVFASLFQKIEYIIKADHFS